LETRLETNKTGRRESGRKSTLYLGQRIGKIAVCGHKVIQHSVPSSNCFDCWHYWFSINAATVYSTFEFLRNGKEDEIRDARGTKFLKQFKKFVVHVQSIAPIEPSDAVSVAVESVS
jgi:hypothetical protein